MAPPRYAAKFDLFLSLDCAPTPSTLAQSKERKGSNFAIWQPCIKAISMDKRGCYATGERRLAFYHHYSLLNCYMECVSNYTDDVRKRATKYEIHKIVLDFCCPLPLVCIETDL